MNLRQSHVLVSQPLLKIRGGNLKLNTPRFIANTSPGIFRALHLSIQIGKDNLSKIKDMLSLATTTCQLVMQAR